MVYSQITIKDKNFIKRYIQRKRLTDALLVLRASDSSFAGSVLDFGGGDGEFSRRISERFPQATVFCYEPAASLRKEASEKLKDVKNVILVSSLDNLSGIIFDYIFCLEVFEHLPARQTMEALQRFDNLLGKRGVGVIGVPNEIFIPALFKGLFRIFRRYGEFDACIGNIARATLGIPPKSRPVAEISQGLPYHFQHLGFDYREFKSLLMNFFSISEIYASPFRSLGVLLNSEIYFILKKE